MNSKPLYQLLTIIFVLLLSQCGQRPTQLAGSDQTVGYASWYGEKFHGKATASGEAYNMYDLTAAHRQLPFGTKVVVRHVNTGKEVTVRINDRGPFVRGRLIDLSYRAAASLGILQEGTAQVQIRVVGGLPGQAQQGSSVRPGPSGVQRSLYRGQALYLQVGSFSDYSNARARVDEVKSWAEELAIASVTIHSAEGLHRVWLGPLSTEEQALALQRQLAAKGLETLLLRR